MADAMVAFGEPPKASQIYTEVRQFALKQFASEVEKWRKQGKSEAEGIIPVNPFFGSSFVISLHKKNSVNQPLSTQVEIINL
ncbi:hypothetical protein NDI39_31115 [Microcoleus sp. ZQ-A2]|nr:hypothetical protein [Microcoleus sp. FACHB-1]